MKVPRRVDAITALQRLSRPRLPVVATPLASGGWNAPTFENSWENFEAAGTNMTAGYRKGSNGMVTLRGLVKHTASLEEVSTIFTLPVGFRPSKAEHFIQAASTGVTSFPFAAQVAVLASGEVIYVPFGAGAVTDLGLNFSFYPD